MIAPAGLGTFAGPSCGEPYGVWLDSSMAGGTLGTLVVLGGGTGGGTAVLGTAGGGASGGRDGALRRRSV